MLWNWTTKRDFIKIFVDEIFNRSPTRKYPTNKTIYNHIDEKWSINLADMNDYRISNNRGSRSIFTIIDKFSKSTRCIPLKIKNIKTTTEDFSNILTTSKRSPIELESDRRAEIYNLFSKLFKSYYYTPLIKIHR